MEDFEIWKEKKIESLKYDLEYYKKKVKEVEQELKVYEV